MRARILIVEDEPKLAALLRDYLVADGHEVEWLDRGDGVADWLARKAVDLLVLDLMLPGTDGLSICRTLRGAEAARGDGRHLPVIMLTARVDEIDRLLGLELGADDYVCKPFSPRELVARVRALLRRARDWATAGSAAPLARSRLAMDAERHSARLDGHALDLTPVEFRLLETLSARPGAVLSRTQLLDVLYLDHRVVGDRTVDSHVKNLRRKLALATGQAEAEDLVESVYGIGYRYVGD